MVDISFSPEKKWIKLSNILPAHRIKPSIKSTKKYRQIFTSVREIGIVEPLVVYPQDERNEVYLLLDGHMRLEILTDLGKDEAPCLIAKDDEGYTYNTQVNRLSPIQEHFMILKAVEKGVSEERISKTLHIDIAKIQEKVSLLKGIVPEAVELLRNKPIGKKAIAILKKMAPLRQIDAVQLMVGTNKYTLTFAQTILAATSQDQLVNRDKPKKLNGMSQEAVSQMEKEMAGIEREYLALKDSFGKNHLDLVLASRHLSKVLDNARVVRYLSSRHADILSEFNRIIDEGF